MKQVKLSIILFVTIFSLGSCEKVDNSQMIKSDFKAPTVAPLSGPGGNVCSECEP